MDDETHKTMTSVDALYALAELEHCRRHCIIAVATAPEDQILSLLILASKCQKARRELQKKYFPVDEWGWCIVKSAARLMQLTEEIANGDADEIKELKEITDLAIEITTGEDISGCSACRADKNAELVD